MSALIACVCLVLAACGGGGSKVAAVNAPAPAQPSATSVPASSTTVISPVVQTVNARYGTILVNANGFVLYSYSGDTPARLGCSGPCLALWSPVLLPAGASTSGLTGLGTVARPEGVQVTYRGHPLYRFVHDTMPGQATGEGFGGGSWTVVVVASGGAAATATGSTRDPAPAVPPAAAVPTPPHATQAPPTIPPAVTQPAVTVPPPTQAPTTRPASPPTTAPGGGPSY